jgi:hypothetical protein
LGRGFWEDEGIEEDGWRGKGLEEKDIDTRNGIFALHFFKKTEDNNAMRPVVSLELSVDWYHPPS